LSCAATHALPSSALTMEVERPHSPTACSFDGVALAARLHEHQKDGSTRGSANPIQWPRRIAFFQPNWPSDFE
jgi:hypothetical protein